MATSRSCDPWIGSASLFSGRPDPTWPVADAEVRELMGLWERLEADPRKVQPAVPPLGYRGCSLTAPDGRCWHALGGRVTTGGSLARKARRDPGRTFEKKLLATAPPGILPASFLNGMEPGAERDPAGR